MGRLSELLTEQIKSIDTDSVKNWSEDNNPEFKVVEEQKVFFWIRLYTKEELTDLNPGDIITMKYTVSGEKLETQFFYYAKKGLMKDHDEQIVNWTGEDDKKCLCLMIDERTINYSQDIPFIRTLFKNSIHYEYQLVRRDELIFINNRTGQLIEYIDCDY
jgi:hypothetical protein